MTNTEIIIALFIICISLLLFVILKYKNNKSTPKYTPIHLPQKIYPQRTINTEYGFKTFLGDIVTFGGHSNLKQAQYDYETAYINYSKVFNKHIDCADEANNNFNHLGLLTFQISQELEKSNKLLNNHIEGHSELNITLLENCYDNIWTLTNYSYDKYETGIALLQGTAIGGLAAVGSWAFVSLVGTASTGTAIASLSGVAAYNATLAWFGGGALAAGGGGMAAGATTLGLIVAVPAIAFATYKSYSKATELNEKINEIKNQENKLKKNIEKLQDANRIMKIQLTTLRTYYEKLQEANVLLEKIIYPNGFRSKIKRKFDNIFNKEYYSHEEIQQIEELAQIISEIHALFLQNNKAINQPSITYKHD